MRICEVERGSVVSREDSNIAARIATEKAFGLQFHNVQSAASNAFL